MRVNFSFLKTILLTSLIGVFLFLFISQKLFSQCYSPSPYTPNNCAHALDTNIVKYYPLKVGNSWIYYFQTWHNGNEMHHKIKVTIEETFVINNHSYYKEVENDQNNTYVDTIRIDSTTGNLLKYSLTTGGCYLLTHEKLIDSLYSRRGDTCRCSGDYCTDTNNMPYFNNIFKTKLFMYNASGVDGGSNRYAQGLGLVYDYFWVNAGGSSFQDRDTLLGCVVNGVVYGDTSYTIIGISKYSKMIPNSLSLPKLSQSIQSHNKNKV